MYFAAAAMEGRKLGKGSGGHMEADWASWGSFISRLLGSNISEAVKGVEIYHVTNMPLTTTTVGHRCVRSVWSYDAEKGGGVVPAATSLLRDGEAESNAKSESSLILVSCVEYQSSIFFSSYSAGRLL